MTSGTGPTIPAWRDPPSTNPQAHGAMPSFMGRHSSMTVPRGGRGLSFTGQSTLGYRQSGPIAAKHSKNAYQVGTIVRAALHEQDVLPHASPSHHTTQSAFGRIHTKYRKMIIIARYHDHYTAIPCFSFNGRGIEAKGDPSEFISIQDHRSAAPFRALSRYPPLKTKFLADGLDPYHPKTVAHMCYPVSMKYDLSAVIEGYLDPGSTRELIRVYDLFSPDPSATP